MNYAGRHKRTLELNHAKCRLYATDVRSKATSTVAVRGVLFGIIVGCSSLKVIAEYTFDYNGKSEKNRNFPQTHESMKYDAVPAYHNAFVLR